MAFTEIERRRVLRLERDVVELSTALDAVSPPWSLSNAPLTPHAYDDEFDDGNLTGWTVGGNQLATAIDAYAAFTGVGDWRYSNHGLRPSWLMMQPSSNSGFINPIHKAITVPSNMLVWTRMGFNHRNTSTITQNDHSIAINLSGTSGGLPDGNNYVAAWLQKSNTNQKTIRWEKSVAGVVTTSTLNVTNTALYDAQYVAIQRRTNDYYFWIAGESGNWFHLGTHSAAITPDRFSLTIANTTSTTPGCMVMGIDFVRFSETAGWLP